MLTWTGQAHLLASDIREPGWGAAATCASAWQARVDPDATHGLVGAALALTDGEALSGLWAPMPPCPDDATLLTAVTELEGAAAEMLQRCRDMARECEDAHDAAVGAFEQARADAERALAMGAAAASPAADAAAGALSAAADAGMDGAAAVIGDCEAALEILTDTEKRLIHALNCLRQVPDDLAATYETPYQVVRDGGQLPYDGDFLTGVNAA